jgi:hypothetical protein
MKGRKGNCFTPWQHYSYDCPGNPNRAAAGKGNPSAEAVKERREKSGARRLS